MNEETLPTSEEFFRRDIKRRIAVGSLAMAGAMGLIGAVHGVSAINDAYHWLSFNPNSGTNALDVINNDKYIPQAKHEFIYMAESLGLSLVAAVVSFKSYIKYRESQ